MDVKDRLLQVMKSEGLTSLKFAEIMGVRPSNISHIISGRNNPGYEFISRFLVRFPEISLDWVISGQGDMYRDRLDDMSLDDDQILESDELLDDVTSVDTIVTTVNDILPVADTNLQESVVIAQEEPVLQEFDFGTTNQVESELSDNKDYTEQTLSPTISYQNVSTVTEPTSTVNELQSVNQRDNTLEVNCAPDSSGITDVNKSVPESQDDNNSAPSVTNENFEPVSMQNTTESKNVARSIEIAESKSKAVPKEVFIFYDDNTFEIFKNRSL